MTPLVRLLAVLSVALGGLVLPGTSPVAAQAAPAAQPTPGQSTYVPRTPVRLLDTRATRTPLGPGEVRSLRVAGVQGVPADATAVVLSVTAIGPTEATQVEVTPTGTGAGTTSVTVRARSSASNLVTVGVGPDGTVSLRNARGSVGLIVDLSGHYARAAGSTFVPVTPSRLLDTRDTRTPLGAGAVRTLRVAGSGTRVPAEATAVALNLTAVGATRSTDVRAYPAGPVPFASNSNPGPGRPTSVLAVVQVGRDGAVSVRNAAGTVHVVLDLQGWFVPSASGGSVFHPVAPRRVLDAAATSEGSVRDVVVAGVGSIPAQATGVALAVTAEGSTSSTDVRVYPVPADGTSMPPSSNLNPGVGVDVTGGALVAVGRDGAVRLRTNQGSVRLSVDLLGWYGPTGRGWDVSWPQCTTRGATTSRLPDGGAFAVVGLTRGAPFGDAELPYNECFDAQWRWASSLPGEPAVYINLDATGVRDTNSGRVWAEVCGSGQPTRECGQAYGERIAAHALARMPRTPDGGRPMVWMDVEGPYEDGPFWQRERDYAGAVAVNRSVLQGVVDGLRGAGHRVGTYSDRGSVAGNANDWRAIMGEWRLPTMQNWVFRSPDADPRTVCGPEHSFSGGPVVMAQAQPPTNPGVRYDVDELC